MGKNEGKTTERVPMSQATSLMLPRAIRTSPRCRATHDIPYTLRCVLGGPHPMKEADGVVLHRDKKGNWWETKIEN